MEDTSSKQTDEKLIKELHMKQENKALSRNNNCKNGFHFFNQHKQKSYVSKSGAPPKILLSTYKKRPGTNDAGKEFEYMMCALYALKLCNNDDIVDFKMTTNNEKYGGFDDISLEIETGNRTKTFLLQLKHKENESKIVTDQKLISPNSELSLTKYLKLFKEIDVDNVICLLYTNCPAQLKNGSNFNISYTTQKNCKKQSEETIINVTVKKPRVIEFLRLLENNDTRDKDDAIFQFDMTQDGTKCPKLESFCKNFFLMTGQYNLKTVETTVGKKLSSLLKVDIYDSFIFFMRKWWSGRFILTKRDVISKLVELAMSPWIQTVSLKNVNYKTELLSKGIMNFDITVVKDTNNDIMNNIWKDMTVEPELGKITHKYHIQENQKSKILWFLDKVPLIVKVNSQNDKQVKQSIKLLECLSHKKKLVLVGTIGLGEFPKWKVLENLKDLYYLRDIYDKIIRDFRISLQGRKSINLEELIRNCDDFVDVFEIDELLKMTQTESLKVGNGGESLPEYYIPRKVLADCVNITDLLTDLQSMDKNVLIINCPAEFKNTLNITHTLVKEVDEFLENPPKFKNKNLILLSIDKPCTYIKFQSVHEKLDCFRVRLFQAVDRDSCILLLNIGHKILPRNCSRKQIEETEIFNYFKSELNVLFAPPGMGKSTLFNALSKNCPTDLWVIHVKSIDFKLSLNTQCDEQFLRLFMQDDETSLYTKLSDVYLKNKKILILLDGVDELENKTVNFLLECSKLLSSQGFHVWMSSRENLQEKISQDLELFTTVNIVELSENEQRFYIEERLKNKYDSSDVNEIVDVVFRSSDIANSRQLLGVPLLLYIITENFLTNENLFLLLKNQQIFVLTTMYRFFFEGKKNFHFKKMGINGRPVGLSFEHHLKQYELPALRVCLDNRLFKKLNLDESDSQKFLEEGDKFGIIKFVTEENKAVFFHQTFAEYFACVWFMRNRDKMKLLKKEWFSEKYKNLRLIFDIMLSEDNSLHLAVIYNNKEQFRKHVGEHKTDKAGRNVLYLACCYGMKYPLPGILKNGFLDYTDCLLKQESEDYVEMVDSLLVRCQNIFERDPLFGMNYIKYALSSRCLFIVEACLERKLLSFSRKIYKLLQKYYKFETLAFYASQMNYVHLLQNVLERVAYGTCITYDGVDWKGIRYQGYTVEQTLLSVAVVGTKDQHETIPRKENVASVEEILKRRNQKIMIVENKWGIERWVIYLRKKNSIDKELESGKLLRLACKLGCNEIMKILSTYQATCNGENILHMTVRFGTLNDEVLDLSKTIGLDVNQKNLKGKTPLYMACENSNEEYVKKLLDFGAEVQDDVFQIIARLEEAIRQRLLDKMNYCGRKSLLNPVSDTHYSLL